MTTHAQLSPPLKRTRTNPSSRWPHRAAQITVDIAATAGLLCAIAAIVALALGLRPVVLVSGSMSPAMPAGTLVITTQVAGPDIRVGEVVTTRIPGTETLITHRVVEIETIDGTTTATLKGDANETVDERSYNLTRDSRRAVAAIPNVGRIIAPGNTPLLLAGTAALLIIALIPTRRRDDSDAGPRHARRN